MADAAADVAHVLDVLGHDRFVAVGWSGGGPHALACGAVLGENCAAVATIGGVAPDDAEGLSWLAGMADENVEEFTLAAAGREQFATFLSTAAAALGRLQGPDVAASLGGLVSPVDIAALDGAFADYVARALASSVRAGTWGWHDDDVAFLTDWGFDLAAIRCPVGIWQGEEDRMVPSTHGRWLAAHVRGAQAHLLASEGHISPIARSFGAILDDTLALARGR